jgi:hypothetical protein
MARINPLLMWRFWGYLLIALAMLSGLAGALWFAISWIPTSDPDGPAAMMYLAGTCAIVSVTAACIGFYILKRSMRLRMVRVIGSSGAVGPRGGDAGAASGPARP